MRTLLAALLLSSVAAGCGTSTATNGPEHAHKHAPQKITQRYAGQYPIQVVCTTGMVADLAKNVGGKHVAVSSLMGAGVDPHLYKASPADVARLESADIILYSGWHLEGKLSDLLARMSERRPVVAAAEAIPESSVLHDENGASDPHLWFDVSLWSQAAGAVKDALCQFDPPHAAEYEASAAAYQARLTELHAYAKSQLATIAKERRVLVTAHDAFQYFGRAYELEVRGIQGISTDSEAGVRQINNLVDFLVQRQIKAVFVETSVADENIRALLEGAAAQKHDVKIGGELFSDAMGDEGTPEGTYEGMIRHNVDTIVSALQ
jgi:manganese/zinc/iron transport system substrate-binding protein